MSHVDSITPAGSVTLAPGDHVDFDVAVSGVPGDDTVTFRGTASDGSAVTVGLTIDRAALNGITGGTPKANEVLGDAVGGGTVDSLGPGAAGIWRFRYTAA